MARRRQIKKDALNRQARKDNFYNQYSGYGGSRDPYNRAVIQSHAVLDKSTVENMYAGNWIYQRAVDILPDDSTREWVDFKTEDTDLAEAVSQKAKQLQLRKNFKEAMRLGRLYGGALLILGIQDGGIAEAPLNEEAIKSVDFMFSIDRWHLNIYSRYRNPLEPNYNEPEIYEINPIYGGQGSKIHASRVIQFDGRWLPTDKQVANQGWHDSIITSIQSDLKNFILSNQTAGQLFQDFITKVLKMPNLADLIENQDFNSIEARIQFAIQAMSNVGLSLIQGGENGEEFTKIQSPITGYTELMDKMQDVVASAIGVPKVKLFGQQPGKLSGLDETMKIYHDEVAAFQETELRPKIERVYSLMLKAKENTKGEPKVWSIEFNPLRNMTEMEKAELHAKQSEADERYVNMGAVSGDEVAESRFTQDGFKTDTTLDWDAREEMGTIEEEGEEE